MDILARYGKLNKPTTTTVTVLELKCLHDIWSDFNCRSTLLKKAFVS